jgi:hypothetical protein
MRQMAVQAGAGIHPFEGRPIEPKRVLYIDLENSRRHVRREFRAMVTTARQLGYPLKPGQVFVLVKPNGIDLMLPETIEWLDQIVEETEPHIIFTGPIYKMASGDPTSEEQARAVAFALDDLREKHNVAVVIEAHTPYSGEIRPYGASLWSRWPEFGLYLGKDGLLKPWRGFRDEGRAWPKALLRGGTWKWSPDYGDRGRPSHLHAA